MDPTLKVTCPECDCVLIVNRKTGEVLEVRKPLLENSTGDRFDDAKVRAKSLGDRAEAKFKEAQAKQKSKLSELEKFFKEKKDELKDQPIEKPEGLFDKD